MNNSSKSQFEYVLFDLDETLYPKEAGLMDAIGERILIFMTQRVGIPADDATIKRRKYYQQYGTSLRGLMVEYNIDPADYLAFVHAVDPHDFLGPSPPLADMLHAVPLRKAIFSNADVVHCERVLDTLRVRPHFDRIIDIEAVNFKSKPDPLAYQQALEILDVSGEGCIMIDEKPRNLIPARDLGMTTILVDGDSDTIAIDYTVPTIFHVGSILRRLLPDSLTR
jgi:putative hydrolase of the HAD superfamily